MYRTTGLYVPTHRPLPLSQIEHIRSVADKNSEAAESHPLISQTELMVFVRMFLVAGVTIAAVAVAASLS
ncbi:MAG: hypothetical protein J0H31_18290 [Alphaproteobacteria bacterium]|nr:hypothetical protein [Alphaproteobacteria bacterium]